MRRGWFPVGVVGVAVVVGVSIVAISTAGGMLPTAAFGVLLGMVFVVRQEWGRVPQSVISTFVSWLVVSFGMVGLGWAYSELVVGVAVATGQSIPFLVLLVAERVRSQGAHDEDALPNTSTGVAPARNKPFVGFVGLVVGLLEVMVAFLVLKNIPAPGSDVGWRFTAVFSGLAAVIVLVLLFDDALEGQPQTYWMGLPLVPLLLLFFQPDGSLPLIAAMVGGLSIGVSALYAVAVGQFTVGAMRDR